MSYARSLSEHTSVVNSSRRDSLDASEEKNRNFQSEDIEKVFQNSTEATTATPSGNESIDRTLLDPSARSISGWRWALVCASIYMTAFTYGLDTTIAADIQAPIVQTFGDVQEISWLGTGFLMGSVATILPIGKLYEMFDAKWLFIAGIFMFELGSVTCGAAPNMNALIVGRVLAGIGGSGIYIGGLTFFTGLTKESERGRYIAGIGAAWGIGAVAGPIIGGGFAADSSATWRWAFYINLVIAAICAPGVLVYLPSFKPANAEGKTVASRLSHIDWFGVLLSVLMWVFFVVAATFAGSIWLWNDGRTIAIWVLFGISLMAFLGQQALSLLTAEAKRIFPVVMLRSRTQLLLFMAMSASAAAFFVPIYYIPIYFQFVHGDTAILAAVRLLPYIIVAMTLSMSFGLLQHKIPYYSVFYLVTGIFEVAGGAAMFTVSSTTKQANVYGYSILIAIGAGSAINMGYTWASVKAMKSGRTENIGHSVAFQNVAQIGSGAIALVITGQVFQTYAFRYLSDVLASSNFTGEQIRAAVAGAQSTVFEQIDSDTKALAIDAVTEAISRTYIMVIVAGTVSVAASLLMRWERLFG